MITAAQIANLRTKSSDYEKTHALKAKLSALRQKRQPFYLTGDEFKEILAWKLRSWYRLTERSWSVNTEDDIRTITAKAFAVSDPDKDIEADRRIRVLRKLRGVGLPVASAILALACPDDYAVIDFRVWRQVFGEDKRTFTLGDYKRYLAAIRPLAKELGWPVQEVDLAIWEYDRRAGGHGDEDRCREVRPSRPAENASIPTHELVEQVGRAFQERRGKEGSFSASEFQDEMANLGKHGFQASDYCYNLINRDPRSRSHPVFLHVERGRYRYVGLNAPFCGPVFSHKKGGSPKQVGEWEFGKLTLWEDPRKA